MDTHWFSCTTLAIHGNSDLALRHMGLILHCLVPHISHLVSLLFVLQRLAVLSLFLYVTRAPSSSTCSSWVFLYGFTHIFFTQKSLTDIFSWIEPPLASHQHSALRASSSLSFPSILPYFRGKAGTLSTFSTGRNWYGTWGCTCQERCLTSSAPGAFPDSRRCEHRETDGQYRVDLTRTVGHIKNLILAFESKQTGKLDESDLDLRNLVFRGLISSRCPKKWKGVETSFLRP